jgi:hypothetical protein
MSDFTVEVDRREELGDDVPVGTVVYASRTAEVPEGLSGQEAEAYKAGFKAGYEAGHDDGAEAAEEVAN